MKWLVSGEGSNDIGVCQFGCRVPCSGKNFRPGPMAAFLDALLKPICNYSPRDADSIYCLPEHDLMERSRRLRRSFIPGKKAAVNTGFFFKNALALATAAQEIERQEGCPVCAVLFRDADGTHTTPATEYDQKWDSMQRGFRAAEGYDLGVPMIPKPKSEAWLICALRDPPYSGCEQLEKSLSGNDRSPDSAKKQLDNLLASLGFELSDLTDLVKSERISPHRIDTPSFNRFRECLERVAKKMSSRRGWRPAKRG